MRSNMIDIYTDGSFNHDSKRIGWAYVVVESGKEIAICSGFLEDGESHNRAELLAVVRALEDNKDDNIRVHSDSNYIIQAFNEGWIHSWRNNGWKKSNNEEVVHKDLWMRLDNLAHGRNVEWVKVKAHSGVEFNERADDLARAAMLGIEVTDIVYPGKKISEDQVQRLWITAKKSGYTTFGVRQMLGEYGICSSKNIKESIYSEIMMKARSEVLADIYNDKNKFDVVYQNNQ